MFGSILKGVGLASSILGGDGKQEAQVTGGFGALPQEVQDAYLDTYLPDVLGYYDDPFYNIPMSRYQGDPNDPFYNPALAQVQQYSDAIGGLFSPYIDPVTGLPVGGGQAVSGSQQAGDMEAAFRGMQHLQQMVGMGNSVYSRIKNPSFSQLARIGNSIGEGGQVNTFNGQIVGGKQGDEPLANVLAEIAYGGL